MKKFSLILLMAALALPMMAQFATKADAIAGKVDKSTIEQGVVNPLKAFNGMLTPAIMNRDTETLFWDFEDDADFEGWLTMDNDGDGYGWEIETYYSHNSGSYSLKSRSYYGGALDPDNWLISPEVPLGGSLSFWAMNYLTSYPDNIMVYVCVGTPTSAADFVAVSNFITPPTTWTEYTVDLSDYAGETGCFAFRHYNSYDQFQIYVDDISYTYESGPVTPVPDGLEATPAATTADVTWNAGESTEWNLRYRVYTPEPEATGYFWDFEDETELSWTSVDADGDGFGWFIWDPQSLGYETGDGVRLFGTKCATSASYNAYGALYPDDWMISPKVTLAKDFSFWAAGQDPSYAAEVFAVYVSTTGTATSDFVKISDDIVATSPIEQYTFDLSEYEGMEGYVAIRHYNVYDMFRLNIDNILIGELPEPVEEAEWIYVNGITDPNYTIEGLDPETTYEVQVQAVDEGVPSKWTESVVFTTLEEGETPVDPHMTGYWVVTILADGTEEYLQLQEGTNGDFVNLVDVIYPTYENIGSFYFMIDGVAYGAAEDATEAYLGDADMNPLTEGTNTYFVDNGYSYVLGIHFIMDENTGDLVGYSAYVARGGAVDVDEMIAGKTVASERYFNVAGQEMAQPEGLTIKVITYTDGTTNTVKVVK